jgi:PAS domain S-box-containing protein
MEKKVFMNNLLNYDNALYKFYKTLKTNSLPISSWDFYSSFFDKSCKSSSDVKCLLQLAKNNSWVFNEAILEQELIDKEHTIVVTDSELRIVYASQNIWKMNRYRPDEIIGKKPNMFQGVNTCRKSLNYISKAIKEQKPFETTIVNYRKDGEPYNCWIKGEPIYNIEGKVINFIAFEKEVA